MRDVFLALRLIINPESVIRDVIKENKEVFNELDKR
jgi:hypothetical protein